MEYMRSEKTVHIHIKDTMNEESENKGVTPCDIRIDMCNTP